MILQVFLLSLMTSDLNQLYIYGYTHNFKTTVDVYSCNKLIIKDSYQVTVLLLWEMTIIIMLKLAPNISALMYDKLIS